MFISDSNSVQVHIKNNVIEKTYSAVHKKLKNYKEHSNPIHCLRVGGNTNHSPQDSAEWGLEKFLPYILGCLNTFSNTAATRVNISVSKHATSATYRVKIV